VTPRPGLPGTRGADHEEPDERRRARPHQRDGQGTDTRQRGCGPTRRAFLRGLLATAALARVGALPVAASPAYTMTRAADPPRTIVTDAGGTWVATFTDGARTVALAGPARTFACAVDTAWLDVARADTGPDLLAIGMQ
jgi:hypothetical protein